MFLFIITLYDKIMEVSLKYGWPKPYLNGAYNLIIKLVFIRRKPFLHTRMQ